MNGYKLTKFDEDGVQLEDDDISHQAVRLDHDLLRWPIIWTAYRSPLLTYAQAEAWAESFGSRNLPSPSHWRLPTAAEALLLPDRSHITRLALDPVFFPDCGNEEWVWTSTTHAHAVDHQWVVNMCDGNLSWLHRDHRHYVRAVWCD